jgi:uncharacterized protein YbjT (DUF2867 family)
MSPTVLVTGATGTVGSPLVDDLVSAGVDTRAGVRNPATVTVPPSVETVQFDFGKPETWGFALAGIERVFLLRPPATTRVGEHVVPFVEAAARSGVEHCVVLSVLGAESNPLLPHRRVEKAVRATKMRYTFLRASFFMQNFLTVHRRDVVDHDELFVPAGHGETSFVDARDVAAAAATALTQPGHGDVAYDLTGPDALTYHDAATVFTEVLGRPIEYRDPSMVAFARRMLARGEPLPFVLTMLGIYTTVRLGLVGRVTDDLRRVLGREPRDLRTFVEDHTASFGR